MSAFDLAMKTKSMRRAARIFSDSLKLTDPKAIEYSEMVFMAGAGWAWQQIGESISKLRTDARELVDSNSLLKKP